MSRKNDDRSGPSYQEITEIKLMHEKEWRVLLFTKMDHVEAKVSKINDEMITLKVKVVLISSAFASIITFVATAIMKVL